MSGAALNVIVSPWFDHDRPKAISLAFNGASVGGVLFTPLWSGLTAAAAFGAGLAAMSISLVTLCAIAGWTLLDWTLRDHDCRLAAAANLVMQAAGSVLLGLGEGPVSLSAWCVLFDLGVGNLTTLPPLIAQSRSA